MIDQPQLDELFSVYIPDAGQRAELVELVAGLLHRERVLQSWELGRLSEVTPRQREILQLLRGGHDAQEIAERLGVSIWTIREQTRRMRRTFNVHTTPALLAKVYGERS